jgi:hypothetical protein
MELSGIPHDFNNEPPQPNVQMSSQFSAINYAGEQDAANKFANYDK